jgi:molybdate transport system substrate-binding protein
MAHRLLRIALAVASAAILADGVAAQTPSPIAAAPGSREVVVSAAVSLSDVLQQLAQTYQTRTGELARQVAAGARVDLFISADEAQMDVAASDLVPGTRVNLLSNQLAIAVPDDRPRRFLSARDLADPTITHIAIGDPAAVPAGVYAKRYLQKIGMWPAVEKKIVPAGSVRLALAAVENGAADAAIVYHTDVAAASHTREAFLVPAVEGPRIVYPAAVVRTGTNQDGARRLLAFLQRADAMALFTRAGFLPPDTRGR